MRQWVNNQWKRQRRTPADAGFTMLEVLVAALILGIGMVGIIGMQSTAAIANRRAYDTRAAMELAEMTLERLKRDAYTWTGDASTIPGGTSLGQALSAGNVGNWVLPVAPSGDTANPMINDLGLHNVRRNGLPFLRASLAGKNSRYCVQYRAEWVLPDRLARAEVRVFWANNRQGERALSGSCNVFTTTSIQESDLPQYFESVRLAGMLRWNQMGTSSPIPTE